MAIRNTGVTPAKKVVTFVHPKQIPQTYRVAVGSVFHQWSLLEWSVDLICWRLLGLPKKEGRLVFSHLGAQSKIEIYRALVDRLYPAISERGDAVSVGKLLAKLNSQRNAVAHGRWGRKSSSKPGSIALSLYVVRGTSENRILPKSLAYSSKDVNAIAAEMQKAAMRARDAYKAIYEHDATRNRLTV